MNMAQFLRYQTALDAGWTHCTFILESVRESWNTDKVTYIDGHDPEAMRAWCERSCRGDYVLVKGSVLFEDPRDALMFKLAHEGIVSYRNENNRDI